MGAAERALLSLLHFILPFLQLILFAVFAMGYPGLISYPEEAA